MSWYHGRPQLMLTGHRSAEAARKQFDEYMIDIAYVVEATPEAIFVVADAPDWPTDQADYEWLCEMIRDTLANIGINDINFAMVPEADRVL